MSKASMLPSALASRFSHRAELVMAATVRETADAFESVADFTRSGGAVLMVTHDDAAMSDADRVLHLKNGRLGPAVDGTAPPSISRRQ